MTEALKPRKGWNEVPAQPSPQQEWLSWLLIQDVCGVLTDNTLKVLEYEAIYMY